MKIGFLFLALVAGMTSFSTLYADDRDDLSDQVLLWVKEGKVIPFTLLMQRYEKRLDGRLLDLEVERENDRIIYELEIMRSDSVVYEIKIDAQNGEWLEEEVDD